MRKLTREVDPAQRCRVVHRFDAFSDDFAAWVFFYGPEGGEREGAA